MTADIGACLPPANAIDDASTCNFVRHNAYLISTCISLHTLHVPREHKLRELSLTAPYRRPLGLPACATHLLLRCDGA